MIQGMIVYHCWEPPLSGDSIDSKDSRDSRDSRDSSTLVKKTGYLGVLPFYVLPFYEQCFVFLIDVGLA